MSTPWRSISLLAVILSLLALSIVLTPAALAQDKTLVWERFDVDIAVNADGSFDVVEDQTIRFLDGSFTFGYRELPVRNFGYADNWSLVDGSGNVYRQAAFGQEPYTFTIDDSGYSYEIRWYFPRTANASETYTLGYTVYDGLRYYDGGDQLWWKAIYGDRSFPVLNGQVRVFAPEGAEIQQYAAYVNGRDASDVATATVPASNDAVIFDLTRELRAGQDFEVRVEFTPDVAAGAVQPWQQQADELAAAREAEQAFQDRWGPIASLFFLALGFMLILGGPAALYALWYALGRDKPVPLVADYLPEPPDDLPPGMAGTLVDETVEMDDIIATLVDLARRKAISITEVKEDGLFRTGYDFIYRRERSDTELNEYEQEIIKALFGKKDEVRLSDLKEKFYANIPAIKGDMYDAVVEEGFFRMNPSTVRNAYLALGMFGLGFALFVSISLSVMFGDLTSLAVFPAVGVGITALGMIILARAMPRKTDKGAEEAARWEAFRSYLENIEQYSDLEQQKYIWDQWLPYAIAFGIDKEYIKKFAKVDAPAPGWYIPSPTLYGPLRPYYYGTPWQGPVVVSSGGNMGDFSGGMGQPGSGSMGGGLSQSSQNMGTSLTAMSAGLGSMLSSANSTMTSRPASSSSGGSGGWSGGGGFSGGGSFGGGGGGGGGGGFG